VVGLVFGYSAFHQHGPVAVNPGKPGGSNVDNVIAKQAPVAGPSPSLSLAQQQAAIAAGTTQTGAQRDVNGNLIPANQTTMQGSSTGEANNNNQGAGSPAAQRANQARAIADGERRSPIMAFSGSAPAQAAGQGGYASAAGTPGYGAAPQGRTGSESLAGYEPGGQAPESGENRNAGGFAGGGQRAGSGNGGGASGPSDFSGQLGHAAIQTVRASFVPNRSFLLSAGTLVPCTLQTAINSTQAGFVSCVINHDVYSEDGRVVLLDKGTKVLGQYSGGLQQGQARLFVVWVRALTPRGVAIDLGSPAADELGRSGMPGGVDTQFWQRFGAALMLSVIEDTMNVVGRSVASYGSNTTSVPSNTASIALQSSINIKPILKKNQGDLTSIFVAKDFDFSPVYAVRLRR